MGNPHTHMRGVWLKGFSLVEKGRGGLEEDTPLLATKDKEECANFGSKVGSKETQRLHQLESSQQREELASMSSEKVTSVTQELTSGDKQWEVELKIDKWRQVVRSGDKN